MKKILCPNLTVISIYRLGILMIFLFQKPHAQAQTYVPFPEDSAIWNVVEYGYGTIPPETGTWHYGIKGDTILSNILYHQLRVNGGSLGSINPESDFNPATSLYFGGIREDSLKRIYLRKSTDTTEIVLYDFSLNVGDTFCFRSQPCGTNCLPVVAIDSIQVGNSYRKQFHFSFNGQQEKWIEGIGSLHETWDGSWCFAGNIEWTLNCYKEKQFPLYGACNYPVSIQEPKELCKINSLHKPGQGLIEVNLQTCKTEDGNLQVTIYDGLGKKIKEQTMSGVSELVSISTDDLLPGIYFVRLNNREELLSIQKIIISGQ